MKTLKLYTVTLSQSQIETLTDAINFMDTRKQWDVDSGDETESGLATWQREADEALAAVQLATETEHAADSPEAIAHREAIAAELAKNATP